MKYFPYDNNIFNATQCGSFTMVARQLFDEFRAMDILGDPYNSNTTMIHADCLNPTSRAPKYIPYLACEYSYPNNFTASVLARQRNFVLTISEFAKQNLLRTVGPLNLPIHSVHLGTDPNKWYKIDEEKFKTFTYLTVNTSNERSGFEYLIPAFIEFSKDKDVRLVIKDGPHNSNFANYINQLNNPKIKYSCDLLSESNLRRLYCKSHVFVYANNTTSFGMNIMDAAMCGTPVIATLGSAIKEFLPEWTQPSKIVSIKHKFEPSIFQKFDQYFINYASDILQAHPQGVEGEIVDQKSILESLEYSYANYKSLEEINVSHRKYILNNFTWRHTAEKMISILRKYYE